MRSSRGLKQDAIDYEQLKENYQLNCVQLLFNSTAFSILKISATAHRNCFGQESIIYFPASGLTAWTSWPDRFFWASRFFVFNFLQYRYSFCFFLIPCGR